MGRGERLDPVAGGLDQPRQALPHGRVIVHDGHQRGGPAAHAAWSADGQREGEGRPAVRVVPGLQPAAVRFDDGARDRQAHAQPVGLGRVEGLEDVVQVGLVDSRPRVPHGDADGGRAPPWPSGGRASAPSPADSRMASRPLRTRFRTTCCSCTRSPRTGGSCGASSRRTDTLRRTASPLTRRATSPTISLTSSDVNSRPPFLSRPRSRWITSPARLSSSTMSVRISTDLVEVHRLGLEDALGGLGIAEDGGQGLIQLVGQRRGELPHRRHPPDVGEILPEPLRLHLRLPAGQDIGEHLAEELEPLHQLVRPGALGAERAEREGPQERSAHLQRDLDLRLDPELPIRLPIHGRRVRRELVDPREADHLATLQPGHDPGDLGERHRGRSRRRSLGHPRVRDRAPRGCRGRARPDCPSRP